MDVTVELDYGPISATIKADSEEEFEKVLERLLNVVDTSEELSAIEEQNKEGNDSPSDYSVRSGEDFPLKPIAEELDISREKAEEMFYVEDGEHPTILDAKVPGETKSERMENGALILLTLWKKCLEKDIVKTSELKDALRESGLPYDRFDSVYKRPDFKSRFKKRGRGRGAQLKLLRPGQRKAFELMKEMSEDQD